MSILANSNAIESGGYNLTRSLRFRSSASAYLNRTATTPTNGYIWTYSTWFKRGTLGVAQTLLEAWAANNNTQYGAITITSSDTLTVSGWSLAWRTTTQVFRDPSAWYHLVVAIDTTQATGSNRVKVYINGSQITAFGTSNDPTQNTTTGINTAILHSIGSEYSGTRYQYFDGYMAELNFIDGQALTPSSFGSTNAETGVWQPAKYTGTYGTNGFYLNFSNIALTSGSNTGLGKDYSGNGNYWNTNNISVTSGTTYDSMTDVPTLTSATAANYAIMNPLDWYGATASGTLTNGNLTWTTNTAVGSGNTNLNRGSIGFPSTGKYYVEFVASTVNISNTGYATIQIDWASGVSNAFLWWQYASPFYQIYNNSTYATIPTIASGDIIQLAIDMDAGKAWFGQNNTWLLSGNPATGTPMSTAITFTANTADMKLQFNGRTGSAANVINANFGQRGFSYTPPTGFVALNTYNLPTSTIVKGNTVMDATTYTGTGSSLSITNTSAFKPDFVWVKGKSGATDHALYDSVRGTTKDLVSNSTAAETTQATGLTAFNSNGFTVGTLAKMNTNTATYVGWQWQAGKGSTSSNTSGSITSTVSVNATAGFSVVTWISTGAASVVTVGHGLGVSPSFIIAKDRTAAGTLWFVYHTSLGSNNKYLQLQSTAAVTDASPTQIWSTSSTTFGIRQSSLANNGDACVAYCWAEIAGFSKFGSYTGNGSTDGTFVYTGFRPKYILIKRTNLTEDWYIYDTSRITYNLGNIFIYADLADAEGTGATGIDILSNGFKQRQSGGGNNASGSTYIYMAFAENPFKNALAR